MVNIFPNYLRKFLLGCGELRMLEEILEDGEGHSLLIRSFIKLFGRIGHLSQVSLSDNVISVIE